MKKLTIIAALATSVVLTACGDDDSVSASNAGSCKVTSTDNSATATTSVAGVSTTTTFTITEEGYTITYGGYGVEGSEPIDVPNKSITKDELVEMATKACDMVN